VALFNAPKGIAADAAGNLYVADSGNSVIRMITPAGVASTLAGSSTFGFADGPATLANFSNIAGIAVDGAGNVYVGDWSPRRVRRISASPYAYTAGGYLVGLANGGSVILRNNGGDNLTLTANGVFSFPTPMNRATSYNVTIGTQPAGQACTVTNGSGAFTAGNVFSVKVNCAAVSTLAGQATAGYADATGAAAQFRLASLLSTDSTGIALDSAGNVYVADTFNNMIRKVTPAGVVTTLAGATTAGFADATGTAARFNGPRGVAVDGAGNVYVGDTGNHRIRKVTAAGVVTTFAGSGTAAYNDATGTAAHFFMPRGLALDSSGNLYVADTGNHTIRQITPAGVVSRLAGSNTGGNCANGTGAAAGFFDPSAVAVDAGGNVYVADSQNHAIRKITPAGVVTTVAGSFECFSQAGYRDSTGTGTEFRFPAGVALDAAGTVYVADYNNSVIRRINPAGTVTTLVGTTFGYTEGNGATAQLRFPGAITVDASGTLYVADQGNNAIRKIAQ
jgi:sugar lactone lactonase YvrE